MEKVFKAISNSLLTMFLFGLMLLPIASMTVMGIKPQNNNYVLFAKYPSSGLGRIFTTKEKPNEEN